MTPEQEKAFETRAEKHFKGQRELPNGRDFRWNMTISKEQEEKYRINFDKIFPGAPGAGM